MHGATSLLRQIPVGERQTRRKLFIVAIIIDVTSIHLLRTTSASALCNPICSILKAKLRNCELKIKKVGFAFSDNNPSGRDRH